MGSDRQMLARLTTANPPRPVCPMSTPIGSAIAAAITIARAVYSTCSSSRAGTPLEPLQ